MTVSTIVLRKLSARMRVPNDRRLPPLTGRPALPPTGAGEKAARQQTKNAPHRHCSPEPQPPGPDHSFLRASSAGLCGKARSMERGRGRAGGVRSLRRRRVLFGLIPDLLCSLGGTAKSPWRNVSHRPKPHMILGSNNSCLRKRHGFSPFFSCRIMNPPHSRERMSITAPQKAAHRPVSVLRGDGAKIVYTPLLHKNTTMTRTWSYYMN